MDHSAMSELEEPPAKVLKIDKIDGVTHVTEMSEFPEPFDGAPDEAMLGEESGIIEGGAEPQEEWLSEGILTDDDYNPASQETVDDQTDSQLGTGDEEHLDSTLDSEANVAETEGNIAETEANVGDSGAKFADNGANTGDSEANTADSVANLADAEANITESEEHLDDSLHFDENVAQLNDSGANLDDSGANLDDSGAHLDDSGANLDDSGANVFKCEANVAIVKENNDNEMEIETNTSLENGNDETEADWTITSPKMSQNDTNNDTDMSESVEHLMQMSNIDNDMESQTYTQEYPVKSVKTEQNVVAEGNASDIVIQRVITLSKNLNVQELETKTVELNIEETMKHLDGEKDEVKAEDIERFLNTSTVRKGLKVKSDVKKEQDDGNDTDYLLRMLGEDEHKGKKKLTKTLKDMRTAAAARDATSDDDDDDDDDGFVYKGSSVSLKNLKAAKNMLSKQNPSKAEPEETDGGDDTEMSADEVKTVQKMFGYSSKSLLQKRPQRASSPAVKRNPILNIVERPNTGPTRQYHNKRLAQSRGQSILKPAAPHGAAPRAPPAATTYTTAQIKSAIKTNEIKSSTPFKSNALLQSIEKKINTNKKTEPGKIKSEPAKINQPRKIHFESDKGQQGRVRFETGKINVGSGKITIEPGKMRVGPGKMTNEPEKIKNEPDLMDVEEYLDEDEFKLDEDEFAESDPDMSQHRQRIMRPEIMDEEVPSDGDSCSEDGSLYDELPSSDSEDMDDWFTLDIRSEKAGDYIPLLGPKAKELLLEEKRRVSARLTTLKQSHTALIASGKQQAATLRRATATLAELDDMLRAA